MGNPGPGGWACLLQCGAHERPISGGEKWTTNNRMELRAVIEGLRALNQPCQVEIVSDSLYVQRGMSEHLPRWKTNGWRTSGGEAVADQDLWVELDSLAKDHVTTWNWVRGHRGDPNQQRCDALATQAARRTAETA